MNMCRTSGCLKTGAGDVTGFMEGGFRCGKRAGRPSNASAEGRLACSSPLVGDCEWINPLSSSTPTAPTSNASATAPNAAHLQRGAETSPEALVRPCISSATVAELPGDARGRWRAVGVMLHDSQLPTIAEELAPTERVGSRLFDRKRAARIDQLELDLHGKPAVGPFGIEQRSEPLVNGSE